MRSFLKKSKASFLVVAGCFCLFFLQACITGSGIGPTPEAPFVLNFDFQNPITVSPADEANFLEALRRYTVPSATKIKVDGQVIWPPLSEINTDRVSTSGKNGGESFVSLPSKTQFPRRPAFSRVSKPNSTQFVGFKTEKDMRAFLRAVSR